MSPLDFSHSRHHGSSRHHPFDGGIPRENVIDLRKVQREREAARHQATSRPPRRPAWKSVRLPTLPWRAWWQRGRRKDATTQVIASAAVQKKQHAPAPNGQAPIPRPTAGERSTVAWGLPVGWPRRLTAFALSCLLVALPIYGVAYFHRARAAKRAVEDISGQALQILTQAGSSASQSDYGGAASYFSLAADSFVTAQETLEQAGGLAGEIAALVPGKVASATHLLEGGQELSTAAAMVTELIAEFEATPVNPLDPATEESSALTDLLARVTERAAPIQQHAQAAYDHLQQVRVADLPEAYQAPLATLRTSLPALVTGFDRLEQQLDLLLTLLGHSREQRHLFVFQNSRELRPTGGFIGSIALIDMYRGRIVNLEVPGGGVYDLAGQLDQRIVAPKPLWLVNPHWNIQDSNWFPDFPASAQKLTWFFEQTGGATVDGVFALTPRVVERLLEVSGPIDMTADYGVTVTSDTFVAQAQQWAEVDYDREENQPKKFIADLLPTLLATVFEADSEQLLAVLQALMVSLQERDIQLYVADPELQEVVAAHGWDGRLARTDKDYLYVVATNIAGGKTDHVVDQHIEHQARLQPDGTVVNTVTVTRAHRGSTLDRWESVANVSYLRFYVPQGSTLVKAEGFDRIPPSRFQQPDEDAVEDDDLLSIERQPIMHELSSTRITTEFAKAVFGNWVTIDPGETQTVTIQYTVPFTLDVGGLFGKTDTYSMYIQRQPGSGTTSVTSAITVPSKFEALWLSPGLTQTDDTISYAHDLDGDLFFGALLQ